MKGLLARDVEFVGGPFDGQREDCPSPVLVLVTVRKIFDHAGATPVQTQKTVDGSYRLYLHDDRPPVMRWRPGSVPSSQGDDQC